MAMSKGLKTGLTIAGLLVLTAVVGYVIYYFATKNNNGSEDGGSDEVNPNPNPTPINDGGIGIPSTSIGNDTVFEWKSPLMSAPQVKWMQDGYNRLALKVNQVTNPSTPWKIITSDGVFGSQTHEIMPKVMGTGVRKASWNKFKANLTYKYDAMFPGSTVDVWGNKK